jgi:hypothetical protein
MSVRYPVQLSLTLILISFVVISVVPAVVSIGIDWAYPSARSLILEFQSVFPLLFFEFVHYYAILRS